MKKLSLFIKICFIALSIISCSSDTEDLAGEDPNGGNNVNEVPASLPKLLKSVKYTYNSSNSMNFDFYYNIDGTLHKVHCVPSEGLMLHSPFWNLYFYENNKLVRMDRIPSSEFDFGFGDFDVNYEEYIYSGEDLVQMKRYENGEESQSYDYTFTGDQLTSVSITGELLHMPFVYNFHYGSGLNTLSEQHLYPVDGMDFSSLHTFNEYDDYANPFINFEPKIAFFNLVSDPWYNFLFLRNYPVDVFSQNNPLNIISASPNWMINPTYVYDEDGYPLSSSATFTDPYPKIDLIEYEYYKTDCSTEGSGAISDSNILESNNDLSPLSFEMTYSNGAAVDLDLYVKTPYGTVIFYANPKSSQGFLIPDDCEGCPNNREIISWQNDYNNYAPTGTYEYWLQYFGNCENPESTDFTLNVIKEGIIVETQTGSLDGGATEIWSYQNY